EGRAWRAEYLRRTYGCGAYRPYETLVREAAAATGLPEKVADALEARWLDLPVWSGAQAVLDALSRRAKLAVVTTCSQRLWRRALRPTGTASSQPRRPATTSPTHGPTAWRSRNWAWRRTTPPSWRARRPISSAPRPWACAPFGTTASGSRGRTTSRRRIFPRR